MLKKIAFTMFPVKNTARARAFYEDLLGLKVGSHSSNGVWTEYDLPGGGCLALFRNPGTKPDDDAPRDGSGGSVAFEVDDLDGLKARLKEKGVVFKNEHVESPVCWMSVIADSEGNSIILHKLKPR
jgi:catechol 2,3-dioxygenase-like lactoylglutathione lyase family enzyme